MTNKWRQSPDYVQSLHKYFFTNNFPLQEQIDKFEEAADGINADMALAEKALKVGDGGGGGSGDSGGGGGGSDRSNYFSSSGSSCSSSGGGRSFTNSSGAPTS